MQRFSCIRIKYIIIPLILVALLSFNCFASELVSVNENQLFQIWGANNWNYFQYISNKVGSYKKYYQYNDTSIPQVSNGFIVSGRVFSFDFDSTEKNIRVRIPLLLTNVESFESDIYYGLFHINGDGSYHDLTSSVEIAVATCYSLFNDDYSLPTGYLTSTQSYIFRPYDSVEHYDEYFSMRRFRIYSKWTESSNLYLVMLRFYINVDSDLCLNFFVGMGNDVEFTAPDQGSSNIVNGLNGVQSSIDTLVSSMQQTQGQLFDDLGNVLLYLDNNSIASPESEEIVSDSISKSEELNDLGDALAAVPKPSINNISNTLRPSYSMSVSSPQSVQQALSVIYSWDKFIALIVLFGALGTISYILFGKRR